MHENIIPDALTPEQRYDAGFTRWAESERQTRDESIAVLEIFCALRDMLASRDAELDRLTDDNRRLEQRIERLERAR